MKREEFIVKLYEDLINQGLPSGMYVTIQAPSIDQQIQSWDALLFIHSGLYEGAIFKFNIHFPDRFPLKFPKVQFMNKIYHPLIDFECGYLDYSSIINFKINPEEKIFLKSLTIDSNNKENFNSQNIQPDTSNIKLPSLPDGFMIELLQFIWNIFYDQTLLQKLSPKNCFNPQAQLAYKFNQPDFLKYCTLTVQSSLQLLETLTFSDNNSQQNPQSNQIESMLQVQVNYQNQEELQQVIQMQAQIKQKIQKHQEEGLDQEQIIDKISNEFINEINKEAQQYSNSTYYQ
eukprot:403336986